MPEVYVYQHTYFLFNIMNIAGFLRKCSKLMYENAMRNFFAPKNTANDEKQTLQKFLSLLSPAKFIAR